MKRRHLLKYLGLGVTSAWAMPTVVPAQPRGKGSAATALPERYDQWLAARVAQVIDQDSVDAFLNKAPNNQWAQFDPELGYVLKDSIQRDGIDGCHSIYRYDASGARKMLNFADRPCRINTYGNSFTQCHQVSDGETWQEYLAAHLGEPLRNFGVGGYGVFQAYWRMLRVEQAGADGARNIVFNIWGDDHHRSLMPWRTLHINWKRRPEMFHGNPWTHLAVNLTTGQFEDCPNPCPTPESLYQLCSPAYVREHFGSHPVLQLRAMMDGVADVDQGSIRQLADWAGYPFDFSSGESRAAAARTLFDIVAYQGTLHLLARLRQFAAEQARNILVLLSHPDGKVARFVAGEPKDPYDRSVISDLEEHNVPYVDSLDHHKADFQQFRLTPQKYVDRHYIGHYSPRGNHFFAYAIKDTVVGWLDPQPITYQEQGSILRFRDGS